MRVLTVIGNRPQFVKAAAVSFRLRESADEVLVHTGQHYDAALSQVFFDELELPRPEHLLDLGGGTNTEQTGRMLGSLAPLLASLLLGIATINVWNRLNVATRQPAGAAARWEK